MAGHRIVTTRALHFLTPCPIPVLRTVYRSHLHLFLSQYFAPQPGSPRKVSARVA